MTPDRPIDLSRRGFLGLVSGAVVLAACGKAGTSSSGTATTKGLKPLLLSSDLYAATVPQRFAFGLWEGGKPAGGPAAAVGFKGPDGNAIMPVDATLRGEGLPANRGMYVTYPKLLVPGIWTAFIRVNDETLELPFQVAADAKSVPVGAAAPRAASPTYTDRLGVDPICTQNPPCALHATSLSDVIGKGTPVAVLFATPARCSSQYCGPVLDELLSLRSQYEGKVTMVHVEIYENNQSNQTAPTVQAWGIPSEPWFYTVNPDGTVAGRLDGAFDRAEMQQLLDQLVTAAAR